MSKITITVKDGEIDRVMVLNQPNFEQLAIAYNAYLSGFAKVNQVCQICQRRVRF